MKAKKSMFPRSRFLLLIMKTILFVLLMGYSSPAFADCEPAKLLASDGAARDYFGQSVAVSGDTAIIGAYGDDDNGRYSGSAYIFRLNGSDWVQEAKLTAPDGGEFNYFGRSVGISGDTAVIGAYGDNENGRGSGAAYIFRFNGENWVQEAKLLASDGAALDYLGCSVGINGETAVIGAHQDDDNGRNSGSAYIFRFNGSSWVQEAKLLASDGAAGDSLGCSVAISGDTAVIGAHQDDDNGRNSGAAYIFRFNGSSWVQEAKLIASDGAAVDSLGCSVAICDDAAVIGAHRDGDDGTYSGSAYIFRFNGTSWVQEQKLTALDGAAHDCFGCSVTIFGDTAIIGAHQDDDNGFDSGAAYVFRFNGSDWVQEAKLVAPEGAGGDQFGICVGINDDTVVIGAHKGDDNGSDSGAVYIVVLESSRTESKLLASDGSADDWFGCSVAISGDTAVIGAYQDDDKGSESGSAYIFRFNGLSWAEEAKLLASDGTEEDYFGYSVAISGDTAVIGAYRDDNKGDFTGSAYIFRFNGSSWVQEAKLLASDGKAYHCFGSSVAICGGTAVIGAHLDNDNGSGSGAAYIFRFNGSSWVQEAKLTASDGAEQDWFGTSVTISGDTAVIGAYGDDDKGDYSGSAYIFRFDGTSWVQEAKLLASDGAANDWFGYPVAISGDTAVIGAQHDDDNGGSSGSAYIFRFDGSSWVQEAKILASDGAVNGFFGCSVAIFGDTAVIGAEGDDDNGDWSGSAYIFRFDGSSWIQEAKLLASDGSEIDFFGESVAIWGGTTVIGAYKDDDNGSESGSAYIFDLESSGGEEKLTASDGAEQDHFGCSVSISGGTAVVGAYRDDDNGSDSGSAYIFRFNGSSWVQEAKLLASDGAADDWFGLCAGICGDTAVIGAYRDDDNGIDSGSVYIFRFNGSSWVQEAKLLASDGAEEDWFGRSVAIYGDTAVIGAYGDDDNGSYSGSAYVFRFAGSSWVQEAKLTAFDGAASDHFGYSVAIFGDTAVIGAYNDDDNGDYSGSAYIFRFNGSSWVQEAKLTASDGAEEDWFGDSVAISGDTAVIGADGDDENGEDSGSAYIFRFTGSSWVQEAKLLASDGAEEDYFGLRVGICGDAAVIGACYDDDNEPQSGSAYIFRFNGSNWVQEEKLLASDGAAVDYFGYPVAISGDTVVIGANHDDDNGDGSGSAYIFGL